MKPFSPSKTLRNEWSYQSFVLCVLLVSFLISLHCSFVVFLLFFKSLCLLISTTVLASTALYVDAQHGIDGGNCTQSTPCQTIAFAVGNATSGDRVLLVGGGPFAAKGVVIAQSDLSIEAATPATMAIVTCANINDTSSSMNVNNASAMFATQAGLSTASRITLRGLDGRARLRQHVGARRAVVQLVDDRSLCVLRVFL